MDKSRGVILVAGLALIAGFFLPWVDLGGVFQLSGLNLVMHGDGVFTRAAIALCPLVGGALVIAALGSVKTARALAFFTGGGVLLYFFGHLAWGFLKTTGVGLWLVLGASAIALAVGLAARRDVRDV